MKSSKLTLRTLLLEDEVSFRRAVAEFKNEVSSFEFAFEYDESISFADYVKKINGWPLGKGLPDSFVPNTFLVGIVDGQVVGRISIRHCLTDFLERIGGHVGYGVIPSRRKQGYATEMLRQSLPICLSIGLARVLVTCDVSNPASRRVIEKCGGVFENITDAPELGVQKRRYWVDAK